MIEIYHPRYNDSVVLLARYRLPAGQGVKVHIKYGAYRGYYGVSNADICSSPIEPFITKNGRKIQVRAVPLEKLVKLEEEDVYE